jgi:hypothetical protein
LWARLAEVFMEMCTKWGQVSLWSSCLCVSVSIPSCACLSVRPLELIDRWSWRCVSIVPLEINVHFYFLTSNRHSQRDGCVNLGNRTSTG